MSKRILAHPFFVLFKRSRGSCPLLLCLASPEGQGEGELRSERRDTPFTLFATASIHAKDRCQFVLHPYSTDHVAYIVGKMGTQFERNIMVDKEPFFSLSSLLLLTKASVPTRERVNGLRHSHGRLATQPITLWSLSLSLWSLSVEPAEIISHTPLSVYFWAFSRLPAKPHSICTK